MDRFALTNTVYNTIVHIRNFLRSGKLNEFGYEGDEAENPLFKVNG